MRRGTVPGGAWLALLVAACGRGPTGPADPPPPSSYVRTLEVIQGAGQSIGSGRRSPEPFRVRALDGADAPVADAEVHFALERASGRLTQPVALTDSAGVATTWLLEARPGEGRLLATSGQALATLPFDVERAPGKVVFEPGTGAVGLPGLPHPDSIVRLQAFDSEGAPLAGEEVWFAGPAALSRWVDTTDAEGRASTVIRRSQLDVRSGGVWAFFTDYPAVRGYTPRPLEAAAHRVVLVSVDGLRADALERWSPPALLRMAEEGALAPRARTVVPSLTTPATLSLLTGVGPATHGVWGEELAYTDGMAALSPPFRRALDQGLATAAFTSSPGPLDALRDALQCRLALGLDSLTMAGSGAAGVVDAAAADLADPHRRLVFLELPDPDEAGHAQGFTSDAYGRAVLAADSAVARILALVPEGTLVVVTSDHGGGGAWGARLTGSDAPADVDVPLLLWGPRVDPGVRLDGGSILDVAPTLLWALGMAPPLGYEGHALLGAFR